MRTGFFTVRFYAPREKTVHKTVLGHGVCSRCVTTHRSEKPINRRFCVTHRGVHTHPGPTEPCCPPCTQPAHNTAVARGPQMAEIIVSDQTAEAEAGPATPETPIPPPPASAAPALPSPPLNSPGATLKSVRATVVNVGADVGPNVLSGVWALFTKFAECVYMYNPPPPSVGCTQLVVVSLVYRGTRQRLLFSGLIIYVRIRRKP